MSITKVACPSCKAVLKSSKPMPYGKQITCVKCQTRFAVSTENELSVTGESHAGTSHMLAETQAGLAKSPMADTLRNDPVPRPSAIPPVPVRNEAAKPNHLNPDKAVKAPAEDKTKTPKPQPRKNDFKLNDGKSIVTVRRQRRGWGGLIIGSCLFLLLAGGAAVAVIYFPERLGLQKQPAGATANSTPQTASVAKDAAIVPASIKPAPEEPKPMAVAPAKKASVSQQQKINEAIDKGVRFLCSKATMGGNWTVKDDTEHPVGYAALPALALLESKVPPNDPIVAKAAEFVRSNCEDLADTYDLGLAVLLLDRLGNPSDEPLLQNLAMRLIAGQTAAGGWDYKCPVLPLAQSQHLLRFLQGNRPKIEFLTAIERKGDEPMPGESRLKAVVTRPQGDTDQLPAGVRDLPIVAHHASKSGQIKIVGRDDNSNTQFGLLGLWAARRHRVPTELSLELAGARFHETQNPSGGWGYAIRGPSKNTMTCVGLLGLAMSHGAAVEAYVDAASKSKIPPQPPLEDKYIKEGLWALGQFVDGDDERRGLAGRLDFYYLWTLERVGMLYQREKFGNHDWYQTGVKILLEKQISDGSWQEHYNPIADTSFALLFLNRSDLVRELTSNLRFYVAIPK